MSRIGISFEDVSQAIAVLQGRQKNPTVDHIREVLGTGSKSTIARYLREWKAKQGLGDGDDARLPSELLSMIQSFWDSINQKAEAKIDEYAEKAEGRIAAMQSSLDQAKRQEVSLKEQIHALEENLHRESEEGRNLKGTLLISEQDNIRLAERINALETRRAEYLSENERLHQLLKHVQENLEHYQAASQKLREEQSFLLEKQRNEYEARLAKALTDLNTSNQENVLLQSELSQVSKAQALLHDENKRIKDEIETRQSENQVLKLMQDKFAKDNEMLIDKNQSQAAELAAQARQLLELEINHKNNDEKIKSLEKNLEAAHDKIETLRHDHQFTLQEKSELLGQLKRVKSQ